MHARIQEVRARLLQAEAEALLSLAPPDNQYLTGFMGSTSAVVVTETEALFLCDFRYTEQAQEQVYGCRIEEIAGNFLGRVGEQLDALGVKTVAFDPASLTVAQLRAIEKVFHRTLKPIPEIVSSLRMIKSPEEVERIRAASELAEGVLQDLLETFREGMTETELAARFEYELKRRGADGAAFDTIALFGPRSSMPHGRPGNVPLKSGDLVLLDLGCRKHGYCSDLTRTYVFGTIPGAWFDEIYTVTLAAQRAALDQVRSGVACRDLDAVARTIIAEAGYGKHFGHGLGHAVGIEIHENPRLGAESDAVLQAGMVVTIEPGIYLPGRGGVRIEDLVVVTEEGCDVLTRTPKELQVLKK
jgi:Xaa-Pro aminopeptidase